MTPGQRAYSAKVNQLAPPGSGISIDEAQTVVSAQQLQMLDDMIAKQSLELTTQTAITAAMRNGKKAADDAAVAMQVLGITFEQLGKITPELQVKLDVLTETLGQIREQARAQAEHRRVEAADRRPRRHRGRDGQRHQGRLRDEARRGRSQGGARRKRHRRPADAGLRRPPGPDRRQRCWSTSISRSS